MTRVLKPALLALLSAACVQVEATTRTERGPLLRTFHRPQVLEGETFADARVDWPTLKLTITGNDTCRDLELEEYAEERITERSAPTAGPALSTGITTLLASAVLLGVSFAVPASPDTSVIDRAGNYGPSTQQLLRGWSLGALIVGVPALGVGLIGSLRSNETTEHLRSEQVVNQRDTVCNPRPLTGPVTLQGPRGPSLTKAATDGAVDFSASEVTSEVNGLLLGSRELTLGSDAQRALEVFSACLALEREPLNAVEAMVESSLLARLERLKRCATVRGAALAMEQRSVEAALEKHRQRGSPGAFSPSAEAASFEDAVAAWRPRLVLAAGSADLARLDDAQLEGQPALVKGIVVEGMASNIGVIQVGERQLYVFLPPKRTWGFDFGNGTRVEAVVLLAGKQTVGDRTLPLARAVWMRPVF